MQPHEWGIVLLFASVLFAVAGFLAVKVISHGEMLAQLTAQHEGIDKRLDNQDRDLSTIDGKLDQLLIRMGVRSQPPGSHT